MPFEIALTHENNLPQQKLSEKEIDTEGNQILVPNKSASSFEMIEGMQVDLVDIFSDEDDEEQASEDQQHSSADDRHPHLNAHISEDKASASSQSLAGTQGLYYTQPFAKNDDKVHSKQWLKRAVKFTKSSRRQKQKNSRQQKDSNNQSHSRQAQELHSAIGGFYKGTYSSMQMDEIFKRIYRESPSAFRGLNPNGLGLLQNIFHQGAKGINPPLTNAPTPKASTLIEILFNTIEDNLNLRIYLLLNVDNAGFTPLHTVLNDGDAQDFIAYMREVKKVRATTNIESHYANLLIYATNSGFTPLRCMLFRASYEEEIFESYISDVKMAVEEKHISSKQYKKLLIGTNIKGVTPFVGFMEKTTPLKEIYEFYFKEINLALAEKHITREDYKQLLIGADRNGYTPLNDALLGHTGNINYYFQEIANALANGYISAEEYASLLIGTDQAKSTPLHTACKNFYVENFKFYLNKVYTALTEGYLTRGMYEKAIIGINEDGFSVLCTVLRHGRVTDISFYLHTLRQARAANYLNKRVYAELLMGTNVKFSPLFHLSNDCTTEKLKVFFQEINEARKANYISVDNYIEILTAPNGRGVTPLKNILYKGNAENFILYWDEIEKAFAQKFLDQNQYKTLLIGPDDSGYTPLRFLYFKGVIGPAYESYLQKVKEAVMKGYVSIDDYIKLLTCADKNHLTPLRDALLSGNTRIIEIYFQEIHLNAHHITREDYTKLLKGVEKAKFSPLEAAFKGGAASLNIFLSVVEKAFCANDLTEEDYKKIVLTPNAAGITPLCLAIDSNNEKCIDRYLEGMACAVNGEHISKSEMKTLITRSEADEYTALHLVAANGNVKSLKIFIAFIHRVLPEISHFIICDLLSRKLPGNRDIFSLKSVIQSKEVSSYLQALKIHYSALKETFTSNDKISERAFGLSERNSNNHDDKAIKEQSDYNNERNPREHNYYNVPTHIENTQTITIPFIPKESSGSSSRNHNHHAQSNRYPLFNFTQRTNNSDCFHDEIEGASASKHRRIEY